MGLRPCSWCHIPRWPPHTSIAARTLVKMRCRSQASKEIVLMSSRYSIPFAGAPPRLRPALGVPSVAASRFPFKEMLPLSRIQRDAAALAHPKRCCRSRACRRELLQRWDFPLDITMPLRRSSAATSTCSRCPSAAASRASRCAARSPCAAPPPPRFRMRHR